MTNAIRTGVPGRRLWLALLGALLLCALAVGGASFAVDTANAGRIMPGVHVAGVPLGGLDRAAAAARLRAELPEPGGGGFTVSVGGTALWLFSPEWPDLVHPFASAIDSPLPHPPSSVHLMLRYKPEWVEPQIGKDDQCFEEYPELSIADWHRKHGVWVE